MKIDDLKEDVYRIVKKIPKGKVMTYGQIASLLRLPSYHRIVAKILSLNRSDKVPCHRVIESSGKLGGYSIVGGKNEKAKKLLKDGLKFEKKTLIVDLQKYLFKRL